MLLDNQKKNGQQVELLEVIQLLKQLATVRVLGHSKSKTMEAGGNHLADIAAKQAVLTGNYTDTQECPLLPTTNSLKDFLLQA